MLYLSLLYSSVYLTEFSNPKSTHLSPMTSDDEDDADDNDAFSQSRDGSGRGTSHYQEGIPPMHSHDSEISRMEQRLKSKSAALTQEVDNVGHLAESEYNLSEFGDSEIDPNSKSYDGGVFAKAKSEEDRKKAEQLRRERREARSAAKARAAEAQAMREGKAESAWAKKKAPSPKVKVSMLAIDFVLGISVGLC